VTAGDVSARQKIDADLLKLDVQIRLLDSQSTSERNRSSDDATATDSSPTAPMVSTSGKYLSNF